MKRIVDTKYPEIKVRITGNIKNIEKKGFAIIEGNAIDQDGRLLNKKRKPVRRTVRSKEEIERMISEIVASIEDICRKPAKKKAKKHHESGTPSQMEIAFARVEREAFRNEWAQSTQKRYFSMFSKDFLPVISEKMESTGDFSEDDMDELLECLTKKTNEHGNCLKNGLATKANIEQKRQVARRIYLEMQRIDSTLPDIPALTETTGRIDKEKREQLKTIPLEIYCSFINSVKELSKTDPIKARAIAAAACSLRTSEAAGFTSKEIGSVGDRMCIHVRQQEEDGRIIERLKSEAAYRKVICIPVWQKIIEEANEGIIEDEKSDKALITSSVLAATVRDLLIESGLTKERYAILREEIGISIPRDSKGNPVEDPASYILRRMATNLWTNVAGLSKSEVDYMLGHRGDARQKQKVRGTAKEDIERIAEKISSINFDENGLKEYTIARTEKDDQVTIFPGTARLHIEAAEDEIVIIEVEAREPSEAMFLQIKGQTVSQQTLTPVGESKKRKTADLLCGLRRARDE